MNEKIRLPKKKQTTSIHTVHCTIMISLGYPVFSTNKTDLHDINEILLNVALNTINLT